MTEAKGGRISVAMSGEVARLTIDNPSQRNAITRAMCLELQDIMPRLDADPGVALVTIRGAGETFSAGAALNELPSILLDQVDGAVVDQLSGADDAITAVSKPTVALVDGACMGGGWQIASACDFIVASDRSSFAITPAKLGILYPRRGIERLVAQVGPARAKYILLTSRSFTTAEAMSLGLIAETVATVEFERFCETMTTSLLARSRFSMHFLKRLVDITAIRDSTLDAEWAHAWSAMSDNPDLKVGVNAFLRRVNPHFTWRAPLAPIDPARVDGAWPTTRAGSPLTQSKRR